MITLLYITNGITGSGGLERVLSVKASMLANDFNYEVHLLSLNEIDKKPFYDFSPKLQKHSIEVSGNTLQYFVKYKKGIQIVVDEIRPHIICVCDDGLKGFFLPLLIKTKAKWIYERHVSKLIEAKGINTKLSLLQTRVKWSLMERLGKRFNKFIVLTSGNKKEWEDLRNLVVIPNPLPFSPISSSTLTEKIVICVGKISYQKGQDLLLKSWSKVNKHYPDWQLHWYGKEDLQFVDTNNLKHNIYFFPPEKNIEKKYLKSSLYVMSSRFEGFGMVLIEAMACGVPCVSFDCNYGPADIIKNEHDGFLVENGNTELLANRLLALIKNENLRKAMGKNAKENVKRFAPEKIVKQWDFLFKSLLSI